MVLCAIAYEKFFECIIIRNKNIKMQKKKSKNSAQLLVKNATSIFPTIVDLSQNIIFFCVCEFES